MYEVESKSNLNISIKRQWLELERCLFLSFYQGTHRRSECTCSSIHTSAKMCLANSSLAIECRTPSQLVSKLSWDSERADSSDFTLGERKKFTGVISIESGGWVVILTLFATRDFWTEVAESTW